MQPAFRPDRLAAPVPRPWIAPWWAWPIAAAAIFGASIAGVDLSPGGSTIAAWWPGAGLSVLFVLLAGPKRRWAAVAVVLAVTGAANLIGGREPVISVLFAVANAAEAATVSLLLQPRGRAFRLGTTRDAVRFVVAVALGAIVIGVLAGGTTALFDGGGFLDSVLHAATSHAAAVLLIAPFGVLPPRMPERHHWPEMIGQSVLMAVTIWLVFAPGMYLPLSFLPFAFMAWAAFRFPVPAALAQALVTSVAVLTLTLAGGGPFLLAGLPTLGLVMVVEAYMVVLAIFTILLVTARYEMRQATRTALSVSQLITGGFVDSRIGLLIAEDDESGTQVLWANQAAAAAIAAELSADGIWDGPLARSARASIAEGVETMYDDPADGATISLVANRVAGDERRFAVQLADVTVAIRTAQDRRDAELERAAAHRTRVELERQREDFVATTSHELRTPVTSIAGYAELLQDSPALGPTERSWLQVIARNTERLAALADDLLELTRVHPGPQEARQVRLRRLIDDIVAIHQPMADAKDIEIAVEVSSELEVRCAEQDVGRALGNLVSNAIKFTPAGGGIRIDQTSADGRLGLRVTDSGPGMPPETLAHAFERFYRGPEAERESTPGTGLGLAIAAKLAARAGAEIRLVSAGGQGLEATMVFGDQTAR